MPFKINEAPNKALSAISNVDTKRGCGNFWTIVCCMPTLGCTIVPGWTDCNDQGQCIAYKDKRNDETVYNGCCYPLPLSSEQTGSHKALVEALEDLRIKSNEISSKKPKEISQDVVKQVNFTIEILKRAQQYKWPIDYRNAINEVLAEIRTRAIHEQELRTYDETIPLMESHKFEQPEYVPLFSNKAMSK